MKPPLPIPKFPPDASSTGLRPSRVTSYASRFMFLVSRFTAPLRITTKEPGSDVSRIMSPLRSAATEDGQHASGFTRDAFSLVEILTTVALLSFIILGLFAMFNQVQRAFRTSMNQVDQLEAGRAVTEMLPREFEQVFPSGFPGLFAVNFYSQILDSTPLTQFVPSTTTPGTTALRTNLLADCFFLMRQNQTWVGVGYCVRTNDVNGRLWFPEVQPGRMGVGTLYRYQASLPVLYPYGDPRSGLPEDPSLLFNGFLAASAPGSAASVNISNRVCDGVIHFRFRAFNTNGVLIILPLRAATTIQLVSRRAG